MTRRLKLHSPVLPPRVRAGLVDFLGEERVRPHDHLEGVLLASVRSVQDVQGVLAVSRQHKVPVLPSTGGLSRHDVEAPEDGGVIVSLSTMNRILEVNHSERYAVLEPGVTWKKLALRLSEDGGDLILPTAAAPPRLSVWASCLLDGAEGGALGYGTLSERVWGVEAVTIGGEVVRTGSAAAAEGWWGRGPLADLTGLFTGWRGANGIVTRLAVGLRSSKRYTRRLLIPASTRRVCIAAAVRVAREELFDDATVLPWSLPRLLLGVRGAIRKHPDEPEAFLSVDLTATTLPELEYKRRRLGGALSRAARRGGTFGEPITMNALTSMSSKLRSLHDLPLRLVDADGEASLRMLGWHGPTAGLVDGATKIEEAYGAYGLRASILVHVVRAGRFGVVHSVLHDADDVDLESAAGAEARAVENLLGLGFLPHRLPAALGRSVSARIHPGSQRLAKSLRRVLDPEGLLDPARWGLCSPVS